MKLSRSSVRSLIAEVLNETAGLPNTIKVGETYNDPTGNSITVTEITVMVNPFGDSTTRIYYDYVTVDGQTGSESNIDVNFIKLLQGKL